MRAPFQISAVGLYVFWKYASCSTGVGCRWVVCSTIFPQVVTFSHGRPHIKENGKAWATSIFSSERAENSHIKTMSTKSEPNPTEDPPKSNPDYYLLTLDSVYIHVQTVVHSSLMSFTTCSIDCAFLRRFRFQKDLHGSGAPWSRLQRFLVRAQRRPGPEPPRTS